MKLEKGMKIYHINGYHNTITPLAISRVTAKRAYIEKDGNILWEFDRDMTDPENIRPRKSDVWNRNYFSIETEEMKQRYRRQRLENLFSKIKVSELTDDELIAMINIVIPTTKGE